MKNLLYLTLLLVFTQCAAPVLTLNETSVPMAEGQTEIKATGAYGERKDQSINNYGFHIARGFSDQVSLSAGYVRATSNKQLNSYNLSDNVTYNYGKFYDAFYVSPAYTSLTNKFTFSNPILVYTGAGSVGFSILNPTASFNLVESTNSMFRMDAGVKMVSPPTPLVISLPSIIGLRFVGGIFLSSNKTFLFTPEIGIMSGYGDNRGSGGYAAVGLSYRTPVTIGSEMPTPDLGPEAPMEVVPERKVKKQEKKERRQKEEKEVE